MADNPTESTHLTPSHPAFTHTFGISTSLNAEDAFAPTQDRSHFFASAAANAVFAQLEQGLVHAHPVIVITGEASVGKTSVLREACARWGARVRAEWLELPGSAPEGFLPAITRMFGGHAGDDGSRAERVAELVRTLAGVAENEKTPVLVLDDAHTLPSEMLAELARIVSAVANTKSALRVVVAGQPELDKRLDGTALHVLAGVVSVRARLVPLSVPDVRPYLNHRLAASGGDGERAFSRRSARELHTVSRGVPGNIDAIASEAIRIARGTGAAQVAPEHVRTAVAAMQRPRTTAAPAATKAATATPRTERDAMPTTTPPAAPPTTHAANSPAGPAPSKPATSAHPAGRSTTKPGAAAAPADHVTPAAAAPVARAASTPPAPPAMTEPAQVPAPAFTPPPQPESPPLDSGHPRVKEWVSRFTDGEGVLRFGARMKLPPLTEPDALPVFPAFDETPPVSAVTTRRMEHTLRSAPKPTDGKPAAAAPRAPVAAPPPAPVAAKPPAPQLVEPKQGAAPSKPAAHARRAPEPVAFTPAALSQPTPRAPGRVIANEPEPIAFVPQPEDDSQPVASQRAPLQPQPEIVIIPEPIVLDAALLEPAPRVLDVAKPAPVAAAPVPPAHAPPAHTRAQAPAAPTAPAPAAHTRAQAPAAPTAPASPRASGAASPTVPARATAAVSNTVPAAPAPESNRSAKKRKRERERAARQAQQAGSSSASVTSARPSAPSAAPVLTAASVTPKRALLMDDSVRADARAMPAAGPPQPAHWNDGPRSPRHTSAFMQTAVPLLLMVGVASVAIFASTRTGFDQTRARTQVTATTPALPDSARIVPPDPVPVPEKPQPVLEPAPAKFCLAVGTYLFSDRAHAKAKQLARRSRMQTWVESTTSGGSRSYRIMIGGFATESEAERAADRLLGRGLVGEAMVEPITAGRRER